MNKTEKQIVVDLIHSNPERDLEEIKAFINFDREVPLTFSEWEDLLSVIDTEIMLIQSSKTLHDFSWSNYVYDYTEKLLEKENY